MMVDAEIIRCYSGIKTSNLKKNRVFSINKLASVHLLRYRLIKLPIKLSCVEILISQVPVN